MDGRYEWYLGQTDKPERHVTIRTISGSNTSNNVGLSNNLTNFFSTSDIVTAFSVKSN